WKAQVQALMSAQSVSTTSGKSQAVTKADQKNSAILPQEAVTAEAGPPGQLDSGTQNPLDSGDASKAQNQLHSQRTALQENTTVQTAGMAKGSDMLVLKLREDSWIEIRNSKDKLLLSRLARAGES